MVFFAKGTQPLLSLSAKFKQNMSGCLLTAAFPFSALLFPLIRIAPQPPLYAETHRSPPPCTPLFPLCALLPCVPPLPPCALLFPFRALIFPPFAVSAKPPSESAAPVLISPEVLFEEFPFISGEVEEPFLREAFGKEYENYTKNVCRYLGKKIKIQKKFLFMY